MGVKDPIRGIMDHLLLLLAIVLNQFVYYLLLIRFAELVLAPSLVIVKQLD